MLKQPWLEPITWNTRDSHDRGVLLFVLDTCKHYKHLTAHHFSSVLERMMASIERPSLPQSHYHGLQHAVMIWANYLLWLEKGLSNVLAWS